MQIKMCGMCGKRRARYVCQECGQEACEVCFESQTWLCSACYEKLQPQSQAAKKFVVPNPFKLFFLGFFFMVIGTVFVVIVAIVSGETATASTVIFVGPIPIVLGAGPYSILAIVLAVLLTILGIVVFVIWQKRAL